jgi:hypothetical protein
LFEFSLQCKIVDLFSFELDLEARGRNRCPEERNGFWREERKGIGIEGRKGNWRDESKGDFRLNQREKRMNKGSTVVDEHLAWLGPTFAYPSIQIHSFSSPI